MRHLRPADVARRREPHDVREHRADVHALGRPDRHRSGRPQLRRRPVHGTHHIAVRQAPGPQGDQGFQSRTERRHHRRPVRRVPDRPRVRLRAKRLVVLHQLLRVQHQHRRHLRAALHQDESRLPDLLGGRAMSDPREADQHRISDGLRHDCCLNAGTLAPSRTIASTAYILAICSFSFVDI